MSDEIYALTFFCLPCHTSNSDITSFFLPIKIVSNFVNPQVNNFADCLDLSFFELKPLPTAINLLFFFFIEDANEYFSTAR